MKRSRKCIALAVAAAMVIPGVAPGTDANAKAKKPKLSKNSVKVEEGAKKKVTVKNAKGFKLTVKSKKKSVATATKKGNSAFVVTGVKKGKTKVICTVQKGKKKYSLNCKVTVKEKKNNTAIPVTTQGTNPTQAATQIPAGPQGTSAVTPTTAPTPEPTIGPFPKTDNNTIVPYGYADTKTFVSMGAVEEITYKSSTTGTDRKVTVQLPADYSTEKKYPVLYLLHGGTDTQDAWKNMSSENIIANLIAFKQANDMIVVMPNVRVAADDGAVSDGMTQDNIAAFEKFIDDFKNDLKPAIEAKYSVAKGRCNTAVCGYDLGGRIALCIGASMADDVAYTGAIAPTYGVIPNDIGGSYFGDAEFALPKKYSDQSFLMILKGTGDDVVGNVPDTYKKTLTDNKTDCLFLEIEGKHDEDLFKAGLYNFARRVFKRGTDNEGITRDNVLKVPTEHEPQFAPAHQGRIETIEYDTFTYDEGNSVPMKKKANVFLPYDYDPDKKYNVFYLMHGGGENMDTWIKGDKESNPNGYGDYTHNQNMINYMFQEGLCEPCIIVNPTFYRPDDAPQPANAVDLTVIFQYELRNDLIPAVESRYSTYANGDTSIESLKASRMHRGFAGLSMGSATTYESAFYGNYDLFAWFAPYSGMFTGEDQYDEEVERFNKVISDGEKNGMPLGYFYCGNGTDDMAMPAQYACMERALVRSDILKPGRNFDFIMIPGGEHNMWSWHIHLYNTLRIFFTKE